MNIMNNFEFGNKVKLISFHGTKMPAYPVEIKENFWRLVDSDGEIVSDKLKVHPAFRDKGKQALVKFDLTLEDLGLISHNSIPNSIWIFISDLKLI